MVSLNVIPVLLADGTSVAVVGRELVVTLAVGEGTFARAEPVLVTGLDVVMSCLLAWPAIAPEAKLDRRQKQASRRGWRVSLILSPTVELELR